MKAWCRWGGWVLGLAGAVASANPAAQEWPQFRGFRAGGVATGEALPVDWDLQTGRNIRWHAAIPGLAHSSPVVWGDRIYLTTAVTEGKQSLKTGNYGSIGAARDMGRQEWRLLVIDRRSGKILHNQLAHAGKPTVKRHTKATHCNSTPATDGNRVVAIFGSEGLFCFDRDGNREWHVDLGAMDSGYFKMKSAQWGFASSPVIHDGKVIVQCDVQEGSFLAVYDLASGRLIWKTPRQDVPTWSTPTVVTHNGRTQVILNGWRHTGAYDFATGREIWRLNGGGDIPVPTPVTAHGKAFFSSAHGKYRPIRAVSLDARGDITPPKLEDTSAAIPWVHPKLGAYMGTPIVVGNHLYSCDGNGVLACFDVNSGAIVYRHRVGMGGGGFTASMVSDGKHLFIAGETGRVFVVPANGKFGVRATNELDDACLATPAIAKGSLIFRTRHRLVAVGNK